MSGAPGLYENWRRFSGEWRWPDFTPRELACKCGGRYCSGQYWHDPAFLDSLQAVRRVMGAPVLVNSGHRCALWNARVGGAPRSEHKRIAADIRLAGHAPGSLLGAAAQAGFGGFGFYRTFLHIDLRRGPRWFGGAQAQAFWTPIIEKEGLAWWT